METTVLRQLGGTASIMNVKQYVMSAVDKLPANCNPLNQKYTPAAWMEHGNRIWNLSVLQVFWMCSSSFIWIILIELKFYYFLKDISFSSKDKLRISYILTDLTWAANLRNLLWLATNSFYFLNEFLSSRRALAYYIWKK